MVHKVLYSDRESRADAVTIADNQYICGLSRLEGNIWDGRIVSICARSRDITADVRLNAGVSRLCSLGSNIVAARDDGCVSVYSSNLDHIVTALAHDDMVYSVTTNTTHTCQFVSGGWDGTCGVWELGDKGDLESIVHFKGHGSAVNDLSYCPQKGSGSIFCTVGFDGFLRVWDTRTSSTDGCQSLMCLEQIGCSCSWDDRNEYGIYCGLEDGYLVHYDSRKCDFTSEEHLHDGRISRLMSLSSSPEKDIAADVGLMSASDDHTLRCTRGASEHFSRVYDPVSYPLDVCTLRTSNDCLEVVSAWSDGSLRLNNISDFKK